MDKEVKKSSDPYGCKRGCVYLIWIIIFTIIALVLLISRIINGDIDI